MLERYENKALGEIIQQIVDQIDGFVEADEGGWFQPPESPNFTFKKEVYRLLREIYDIPDEEAASLAISTSIDLDSSSLSDSDITNAADDLVRSVMTMLELIEKHTNDVSGEFLRRMVFNEVRLNYEQ